LPWHPQRDPLYLFNGLLGPGISDVQIDTGSHLPAPAPGRRIGIIAARFNGNVTEEMLEGCRNTLEEFGVGADAVDVYWVPGAWELPQAARRIAALNRHDAFIAIGCVIRGETPHFDFVAGEASSGLGTVAREIDIPLLFGVLTTDTPEQAWARASREEGNKGRDLAHSALHMIGLYEDLQGP
jgi:6,7-dimethyl-8-ribityllumazine synthase